MARMHTPRNDLELAHRLADLAGTAIRPHFRALAAVDNKAGGAAFDPVTVADREAEERMRETLERERPDDGVFAEEFAPRESASGRTWMLDPIDGTRAFVMGLPVWGTLIALTEGAGASPHIGIMDQPFVGERFSASPEGALWRRGTHSKALSTRRGVRLEAAIAATTSPFLFTPHSRARLDRLMGACRMTRFGTDCYGYALVAGGFIDIVIEEGLRAFDVAPFVPLIERAGGSVTDFSGAPIGPTLPSDFAGQVLAVGDPRLVPQIVDVLAG